MEEWHRRATEKSGWEDSEPPRTQEKVKKNKKEVLGVLEECIEQMHHGKRVAEIYGLSFRRRLRRCKSDPSPETS